MLKFNLDSIVEILNTVVFRNTISDYLLAFIFFVVLFLSFKVFRFVLLKKLKELVGKTANEFDDYVILVIEKISPITYYVASLYFPLKTLVSNESFERWMLGVFVVVLVVQVINSVLMFVDYGLKLFYTGKSGGKKYSKTASYGVKLFISIFVWIIGFLLILSNLGFNITSLIASLGIGGIAVALALQNILGDLISSFSIYFDRPFDIGDFIVVGDNSGVVDTIGMKTTRLTTLQGEQLVISNMELASSRIQNYKKLKKRRVVLDLNIAYETDLKKLKKVKEIIPKIFNNIDGIEFTSVHLKTLGAYSLDFQIIYFVLSGAYDVFMDKQDLINYSILEVFAQEKIEIAYPTKVVINRQV